jgi:hypothetical protein
MIGIGWLRLIVRSCGVMLTLTLVLTAVAIFTGRGRALASPALNPVQALGLDSCDGKPCFLGLTPAVSRWDEVYLRLASQYIITNDQRENVYIAERGRILSVLVYADRPGQATGVRRIAVKPVGDIMLVGDLFLLYGAPCSFLIESDLYASLTYPRMEVIIKFVGRRVSAFSPIRSVAIFETDLTANCSTARWRAWAGFKHRTAYVMRWPAYTQCIDCGRVPTVR